MGVSRARLWWGIPTRTLLTLTVRRARKAKLITIMRETGARTIKYIYAFGDGWDQHDQIQTTRDMPVGLDYLSFSRRMARVQRKTSAARTLRDFLADPSNAATLILPVDKRRIRKGLEELREVATQTRRAPSADQSSRC